MVRMDGGFYDGKLFKSIDTKHVGFVCGGRISADIKAFAAQCDEWETFAKGKQTWSVLEFGHRSKIWDRWYRAIYLKPHFENDQRLLCFASPDRVIVTKMGSYAPLWAAVPEEKRVVHFGRERIINQHHTKGADELTHRAIKYFGF